MTDLTPVNASNHGANAAPTSLRPVLATVISAQQTENMSPVLQPLDQLALELKSLRQQALSAQTTIHQLQHEHPNRPFAKVLSEFPMGLTPGMAWLGTGALLLGGMLWWTGTRRSRASPTAIRPVLVDIDDPKQAGQASSPLVARAHRRASATAPPKPVPTEARLSPSPTQVEPDHGLDVDLDDLLSTNGPAVRPARSSASCPVAAHDRAPAFDPAAADEVERVLKSLANKRAARSRRRSEIDWSVSTALGKGAQYPPPLDTAAQQTELPENEPSCLAGASAAPLADLDLHKPPSADLHDSMPIAPTSAPCQDAAPEPDQEVQLSLAQEFEALGLTLGARELASEVLNSTNASLGPQAQALLRQIEVQETRSQDLRSRMATGA